MNSWLAARMSGFAGGGQQQLMKFAIPKIRILLFAAILIERGTKIYLLLLPILLLGSCNSCTQLFVSPPVPEAMEYSVYGEDLDPGRTYYWKVVALDANQLNSESPLQRFTTAD